MLVSQNQQQKCGKGNILCGTGKLQFDHMLYDDEIDM